MEKITERDLINDVLNKLSARLVHMVYVFAKSLLAEQNKA